MWEEDCMDENGMKCMRREEGEEPMMMKGGGQNG